MVPLVKLKWTMFASISYRLMEKKKPIRSTGDKLKDVYNTYVRNDEREIDIKTEEEELTSEQSDTLDSELPVPEEMLELDIDNALGK